MPNTVKKSPAGRPFGKTVRIHKTYWVSEEEDRFITEYLRRRRRAATGNATGRDRFAEKKERIRKKRLEQKQASARRRKLLREMEELERLRASATKRREKRNEI